MINGILVINHYLENSKFNELYNMIIKSAYRYNINLSVKTNREIMVDTGFSSNNDKIDFVLFWDKDITLATYIEQLGIPVFNSANAIRICDDKALTHVFLSKYNIPMPRTLVAPFTYEHIYSNKDFVDEIVAKLPFPIVVKAKCGSFGADVHLAENIDMLHHIIDSYPAGSLLFQEYIETSKGRDIRLQVVGNKVVCAMYRYSDTDFRANITNGGKMKEYIPSDTEIDLAINACKYIGLDFAGVDILFGPNDKPILCEVNSNAHFKNIYDCTGVNVPDKIFEYIINHLNIF